MRRIFRALALLLAPLMLFPVIASATEPTPATGDFAGAVAPDLINAKTADGNMIIPATLSASMTDTLEGQLLCEGTVELKKDDSATFQYECTFAGSVDGQAGTIGIELVGTRDAGAGAAPFQGNFASLSGSGTEGLANLHVQGSFTGDVVVVVFEGTYDALVHFD